MVNSSEITEIVQNIFNDIKAEAILGDLIENGLEKDKIVTYQKGTFKRRYSRDIDSVNEVKLKNGQQLVGIHLNRDGLYDSLPEGLFHSRSEKTNVEKASISNESKRLKREEKAAREFFLPFENEIIYQRVELELKERRILSQFSENFFNDLYPELWDLYKFLNKEYVYKMALLLHFSYRIAGNTKLTVKCLESILKEKVDVKFICNRNSKKQKYINEDRIEEKCLLGKGELGVDFFCGEYFENFGKTMVFTIGPLKNTKIDDYLKSGSITKFLSCFYSYFVPAELDVESNVIVDQSKQKKKLGKKYDGPVLGFNSSI